MLTRPGLVALLLDRTELPLDGLPSRHPEAASSGRTLSNVDFGNRRFDCARRIGLAATSVFHLALATLIHCPNVRSVLPAVLLKLEELWRDFGIGGLPGKHVALDSCEEKLRFASQLTLAITCVILPLRKKYCKGICQKNR